MTILWIILAWILCSFVFGIILGKGIAFGMGTLPPEEDKDVGK